ncbi:hypothetical protein [Bacillus sp. AFS088145]|nr:hypothetical protein [Bacillus sp. AFS088145]
MDKLHDTNGVATLYFTDNGLATGNPLLTAIDYAVARCLFYKR